jgi:hypothetical protein
VIFGSDVIFATEPGFHVGLELVEGDAVAGFEEAVGDREGVVEDGVVGEVAHGEVVDPLDGTGVRRACGVDALNGELAGEHGQAKRVNMGESSGSVCIGPESWPVTRSRRKTVTVAESWLPQMSHWAVGSRVKWRGTLPPQEMR